MNPLIEIGASLLVGATTGAGGLLAVAKWRMKRRRKDGSASIEDSTDNYRVPPGMRCYTIQYEGEPPRTFTVRHPREIPEPHLSFIRRKFRSHWKLIRPLYESEPDGDDG